MNQSTRLGTLASLCVAVLLAGCAHPTLERGWIGARFDNLGAGWSRSVELPGLMKGERAAVVVTQVIAESPAARAGLQPGDVILSADGKRLKRASALVDHVRDHAPAADLPLTVLRRGDRQEIAVHLGRETYQREGQISLGLGLSSQCQLWPTDLNIFGLLRCHVSSEGRELHDAALRARTWQREPPPPLHTEEGWRFWLVFFGVGRSVKVLGQEA